MQTLFRTKLIILSFLFITLCLFLSDCEEEKAQPREYPRVNTLPVSNITEQGATFNADLYSLGTEVITEYGFVWGPYSSPSLQSDKIVLPGIPAATGVYSAEIKSTLHEGDEYTVKPYVSTEDRVVYGKSVTFISLGSLAPVITGFEPDSAGWGDTLKISGENFSWVSDQNIVRLTQVQCTVISSTDTLLTVIVPLSLNTLKNSLSVELAGNVAVFQAKNFKLIPPVLYDFYPKQARWGDTVYIKGYSLKYVIWSGNYVKLGDINCQVISVLSDSVIQLRIPYEINTLNSTLNINLAGFLLQGKQDFELLPPYFTFTPNEGAWGNTITLTGRFNTITSRNSVFFNAVGANITSTTSKTLLIKVPNELEDIESNIIYKASPFEIVSSDLFKLKPPVINSFTPVSGPSGTAVTIKGKYFGVYPPIVKFGDTSGQTASYNDSTIVVYVPLGGYGPVKISVIAQNQTVTSSTEFNITNPKIDHITPLTGTFNDEITITGSNFIPSGGSGTIVYFDYTEASIVSLTANSIVVRVPESIDSIPRALNVKVGDAMIITSEEKFTLSPPQILSVSPATLIPGEDVTIDGSGFNTDLAYTKVYLDFCPMTVTNITGSQIIATVPSVLPRSNLRIKVVTGGYTRYSSQTFSFNSQWLRIQSPQIMTFDPFYGYYDGGHLYAKSLSTNGYVVSNNSGLTYKFNSADRSWTKMNIDPAWYGYSYMMGEAVVKDTFYLIAGTSYYFAGTVAFDEVTNVWRKVPSLPSQYDGLAFSVNNKISYGLSYSYSTPNFYECDPGNNYKWTEINPFPQTVPWR